tara:strand:- start:1727 stop:1915 length:189 start_codon:yes stop_codon:yes gene_type:complete
MSDLNNSTSQFSDLLESFNDNITKFNEKGTAAAGKRARKDLLNIQKLCKSTRVDILTTMKNQ